MYPVRALTSPVVLKYEKIFQHHRKKIIIGAGIHMEVMGLENEDFSEECQCMYA